ncbi:MAG: PHB depolymerase family esterase [Candidatus Binataceae bacterium]
MVLCVVLIVGAAACGNAAQDAACGPFGNPPAKIISAVKPDCGAGRLRGPWKDANGTDRYACLYEPASAAANHQLPLLVYLHPSLFPAGRITQTNLLDFQKTFPLSRDPKRAGFIVLAPEGRKTTHHYPWPDNSGIGWDNWYRQLNPAGDVKVGAIVYPENVDAATIDHFIAQETATGKVDTSRIYVSGWSNGAAMGLLYALNRPGVAAVAVYSAPNPFAAFNDRCSQSPVTGVVANDLQVRIFNPRVPVMEVHNSCDVAGICPNDKKLANQLRGEGVDVHDVIVDPSGKRVDACADWCGVSPMGDANPLHSPWGYIVGLYHHLRWPTQWTAPMLGFLGDRRSLSRTTPKF